MVGSQTGTESEYRELQEITDEGIVILPLRKSLTESCRGLVKGKLSMKELEKLYAEKS